MNSAAKNITHQFVEFIPETLEKDKLYITIEYATASHLCVCGCGNEVVTPFSPTDWKLIFDGETVSLNPSIGNWSFNCKSHYWIKSGRVIFAESWSHERIELNRYFDKANKNTKFSNGIKRHFEDNVKASSSKESGFWKVIKDIFNA